MTTYTVFEQDDPTAIVRGVLHWVDLGEGTGVMYEIFEQDGVEIMAPLYWRVAGETYAEATE